MANPFVHVELMATNAGKAKAFYTGLFDWKLEDVPGMDYTVINVGEGTGVGWFSVIADLTGQPPVIEKIDVLAAKLP